MEYLLYLAALILVIVAFIHSILGEKYILIRLFRRDNLPKLFGSDDFTKKTLRFAWHITSIAWLGLAGIMILLAQPEINKGQIGQIIVLTFVAHFAISLIASKGKHLSWLAFLAMSLLIFFGLNN